MTETLAGPSLTRFDVPGTPQAMALFLHGGKDRSDAPVTGSSLSWRRVVSLGKAIEEPLHARGIGLWVLRYRTVGWNGDGAGKIEDARWALDRIRAEIGSLPVVLVGHSMGGRTACQVAGDDLVRGVVALAPWLPRDESVSALAGRDLSAVHGSRDHITRPRETRAFVERARGVARSSTYTRLPGAGHYMLRQVPAWNAFALGGVRRILAGEHAHD